MQVSAPAAQGSSGLQYKWIVTLVVIFGAFMSILDQTIVNIAIPRLQNAFGADLNSVQWVLTAYILTQGVVTPTTAFFADRLGTKRFYILALAVFTAGSALCGLAWSLPVLIIFRVLQGVGGAALFPLAITLLYREFPPQQRGLASGLLGIAALLAPAVGPTLGGYFVTYVNWQLIFFVNVPIGIVGMLLAVILLREVQAETRAQFDVPGFVLAATGLAAVLYALSDASTDGWGSGKVLGFLLGGLIILGFFVFFELDLARGSALAATSIRFHHYSVDWWTSGRSLRCARGGHSGVGTAGFCDVAAQLPYPLYTLWVASAPLRHPRPWARCGYPAAQRFGRVGYSPAPVRAVIHALYCRALRLYIAWHRGAGNASANAGKNPL